MLPARGTALWASLHLVSLVVRDANDADLCKRSHGSFRVGTAATCAKDI